MVSRFGIRRRNARLGTGEYAITPRPDSETPTAQGINTTGLPTQLVARTGVLPNAVYAQRVRRRNPIAAPRRCLLQSYKRSPLTVGGPTLRRCRPVDARG